MPVDDSLLRDAVLVVQNLHDLGEGLDDTSVLVAVQLHNVEQGNLCLCGAAERLQDRCGFLT